MNFRGMEMGRALAGWLQAWGALYRKWCPLLSLFSTSILPLYVLTMRRTTASPMPEPELLVVKKGIEDTGEVLFRNAFPGVRYSS